MRYKRPLPSGLAYDKLRARKAKLQRLALTVRVEQSACMIEMKMTEEDNIDVLGFTSDVRERIKENMSLFDDAKSFAEFGFKERAHTRLDKDLPLAIINKKTATSELNARTFVRAAPLLPNGAWRIAKHRAPIQTLTTSED